jgi:superfamily II DNA or RNA helicase
VLGLSATIARKAGHHPIIFMQCGPMRYRVDAKSQSPSGILLSRWNRL